MPTMYGNCVCEGDLAGLADSLCLISSPYDSFANYQVEVHYEIYTYVDGMVSVGMNENMYVAWNLSCK